MSNPLATDLATARYSGGLSNLLGTPSGSGSAAAVRPGVYPDGDFTVAQPHGHHVVSFPFEAFGDAVTQIVRQRYWQYADNFRSLAPGTAAPGRPDLLLIDEENDRDEGGGVMSWDRVYATLPSAHDEFEDFAYGAQYMYGDSGSVVLAEQVFPVASRVRCEYFHIKDLSKWEVLLALRIVQLSSTEFNKRGQGNLTLSGAFFISTDAQIVAEDSKLKLWHYPFMERRTRYVAGPTLAFWGSSISLG